MKLEKIFFFLKKLKTNKLRNIFNCVLLHQRPSTAGLLYNDFASNHLKTCRHEFLHIQPNSNYEPYAHHYFSLQLRGTLIELAHCEIFVVSLINHMQAIWIQVFFSSILHISALIYIQLFTNHKYVVNFPFSKFSSRFLTCCDCFQHTLWGKQLTQTWTNFSHNMSRQLFTYSIKMLFSYRR